MKSFNYLSLLVLSILLSLVSCEVPDIGDNSSGKPTDGTNPTKPVEKSTISGSIEKGPFVQGAKISLYELESDLSQTGKTFTTQTSDGLGAFKFETSMKLNSQFVELEASGYFYNEVKGELSTSQITLKSLSNVASRNSVNVNLITHLEYGRVKKLVREGMTFDNAKKQAERELLACFAITDEISIPESVSIKDNNRSSAMMLAISIVMLHDRSEAEFTEFTSKFSTDFADNGKIDNADIREAIKKGQEDAHPKEVIDRMKEFYDDKGVDFQCDDFSQYIDFNGDGVIDDDDEEGGEAVTPEDQIVTDHVYNYLPILKFTANQLTIQAIRFKKVDATSYGIDLYDINDNFVSETRNLATAILGGVNGKIEELENISTEILSSRNARDLAEFYAIRAYVEYQSFVVWGHSFRGSMRDPQRNILSSCYEDLEKALELYNLYSADDYYFGDNGNFLFSKNSILTLLGEIELWYDAWGYDYTRKGELNGQLYIPIVDPNRLYMDLLGYDKVAIFDDDVIALLNDEKNKVDSDVLVNRWKEKAKDTIGAWAAVRRLEKTKSVFDCEDDEFTLPWMNSWEF